VRCPKLLHVVDEEKLREVEIDGGLRKVHPGRQEPVVIQRLPAESLVRLRGRAPCGAPVFPPFDASADPGEVGGRDTVRRESRTPVSDRRRHPLIHEVHPCKRLHG
jgi:hypothetical protein